MSRFQHLLYLLILAPTLAFASEQVQSTAPMAAPRRGHTATVLADGRVLIVGGLDGTGALTAAEIFDPSTNSFQAVGRLAFPRYGHTATLLTNGLVLIAGGQNLNGSLNSAELFDPSTGIFSTLTATMGAARSGHTATIRSDGTVLLAGGDSAGTAEIFDPVAKIFYTPLLPMASPRAGHTATPLAGDNVFMVGGGTTSIELFNAASNSFSLWPPSLSKVRSGHSSIPTLDSRLLVIGGDQAGTFELFDPNAGSSLLNLSLGTPTSTTNRNPVLKAISGKTEIPEVLTQFDQLFADPPPGLNAAQIKDLLARRQAAKQELVEQLSSLGPGGAHSIADAFRAADNLRDRLLLAQAFGKLNDRETVAVLKDLLSTQAGFYEQQQLIIALGHRGEPSVVEPLKRMLSSDTPGALQFAAVQALAGRADALPALETVIENGSDRTVRLEAIRSIGLIGNDDAKATLIDFAQAPALEPLLRQTAIQELRRSFGAGAQGVLQSLSHDTEPAVRESASRALAMLQK